MPDIYYDVVGRRYERFINLAVDRSDAVLLVHRKMRTRIHKAHIPDDLRDDVDLVAYRTKLELRSVAKLQKYHDHCIPFLEEIKPFLIKVRHNTVWPGTMVGSGEEDRDGFDICVYRTCHEIKQLLLRPRRLFGWIYPDYPEDLCFLANHVCWFYSIAHEEQAFLHADDEKDVEYWKRQGLTFSTSFNEKADVQMRLFEDY